MSRQREMMKTPLRAGLLPLAIVGWGILRDWWWLGLLLAVVLELPRFIKGRKDFLAPDFSRAFTLSWLLLAVVGIILWLQDAEREGFELLVECLPLFFLPVMLCQLFAKSPDYPLHVSTLLSQWRHKREKKRGMVHGEWRMNFGYFYLLFTLVGASWNLDSIEAKGMFAVLVALVLWRLLFFSQPHRRGELRIGGQLLYLVMLVGAASLGFGAIKLYKWLESGQWINYVAADSPVETATQIGKLGEIIQDPRIHWRIIAPETAPPPVLKDRVFNRFINGRWDHVPVSGLGRDLDYQDFNRAPLGEKTVHIPDDGMSATEAQSLSLSHYRLRGKGRQRTLLPNTNSLVYMENDSVEGLEFNSLGTVLATNPITGVLDYIIHSRSHRDGDYLEMAFSEKEDLQIPENVKEALSTFLTENEITAEGGVAEAVRELETVFKRDFTYSLRGRIGNSRPISQFLHGVKSGHCEYFATAGCLLLRELGFPARYTLGYTVREYNEEKNEWVLRGIHAHAWIRYWDEEKGLWLDADFTPPGDLLFNHASPNKLQDMQDAIKRWREDFIVWRSEDGDHWFFTVLPWFLVLVLIGIFGRNLLKVRSGSGETTQLDHAMTPLVKVLKVDPRKPSETFGQWLHTLQIPPSQKEIIKEKAELILYGGGDDIKGLKETVKEISKRERERPAR